jgi:hypothetical protein
MDAEHPTRKRRHWMAVFWVSLVVFFAVVTAMVAVPFRPPTPYPFITEDHPIDVMSDGTGRWYYYMTDPAKGSAPVLAATVRKELQHQGFTEDTTNKPWFRFVKGAREVIVCNHDEIAANHTSLTSAIVFHGWRVGTKQGQQWPVLWVHEPGRDTAGVAAFKVKKLVYRW